MLTVETRDVCAIRSAVVLTRDELTSLSRVLPTIVRGYIRLRGARESIKRDRNIAELTVHRRGASATLRVRGRRREFTGLAELHDYGQSYSYYRVRSIEDVALAIGLIESAVANSLP